MYVLLYICRSTPCHEHWDNQLIYLNSGLRTSDRFYLSKKIFKQGFHTGNVGGAWPSSLTSPWWCPSPSRSCGLPSSKSPSVLQSLVRASGSNFAFLALTILLYFLWYFLIECFKSTLLVSVIRTLYSFSICEQREVIDSPHLMMSRKISLSDSDHFETEPIFQNCAR